MEKFLNIIHYKLFIWFKFIDRITNYINPIWWIVSIPVIKRFHKKKGIDDFRKLMDEQVFNNKINGFNITYAGMAITGLLALIMFSLFNLLQVILQKQLMQYVWNNIFIRILFIISLCIIPWRVSNKMIFDNNKYLKYFNKFEKQSRNWQKKWTWLSLLTIIITSFFIGFVFYLFILMIQK